MGGRISVSGRAPTGSAVREVPDETQQRGEESGASNPIGNIYPERPTRKIAIAARRISGLVFACAD